MFTAPVAEILHAKDPAKFAALIAHFIKVGLLQPQVAAGDSWAWTAGESAQASSLHPQSIEPAA
jgi:hypothetical protein